MVAVPVAARVLVALGTCVLVRVAVHSGVLVGGTGLFVDVDVGMLVAVRVPVALAVGI
jgi:hypothetical protein